MYPWIQRDTVCKEERIDVATSNGKSAMANVLLKRAHNKNGGDTIMPQDLSQEGVGMGTAGTNTQDRMESRHIRNV